MNRRIFTQLVLPLSAAVVLSILIHLRWPADGFFLNLAAGFVGSLVTVGYIDWILRRNERETWSGADSRIRARLSKLATATITDIRTSFGYGPEVFDRIAMATGNTQVMLKEVQRVATQILAPTAEESVSRLNQEQWLAFVTKLKHSSEDYGLLLGRFCQRLDPLTIEIVLDLQDHLNSAQTYWRLFPDVAGVPVAHTPKMTYPPEEMQAAWCSLTAKDVRRVLELATKLSESASNA